MRRCAEVGSKRFSVMSVTFTRKSVRKRFLAQRDEGGARGYLAALAGQQAVVVTRHFVTAHRTQLFQVFIIRVLHHLQSHA